VTWETLSFIGLSAWETLLIWMKQSRLSRGLSVSPQMVTLTSLHNSITSVHLFERLDDIANLDEAVTAQLQAVRLTLDGHPDNLHVSLTSEPPSFIGFSVWVTLSMSALRLRFSNRPAISPQMVTLRGLLVLVTSETPPNVGLNVWVTWPIDESITV
jgi:hypothetical protein